MKNIILSILVCFYSLTFSQSIKVSNIVSENKITPFSEQKLILIDFWATWCTPCVYATQQLEILQRENKEKVFIISISDEHESKIAKYLEKIPINLMVTSDFGNYTFEKYNVQSRPYAVLLDLKGNTLWKGNPSDLSQQKLDNYYSYQSNVKSIYNLDNIVMLKAEETISTKLLIGNKTLLIEELKTEEDELIINDDEVYYSGSLSNLFYVLKSLYPFELKFDNGLDKKIKIVSTKDIWNNKKDLIIEEVLKYFKLEINSKEEQFEGFQLIVYKGNLLWDSTQLDWGNSASNYIVGTDRIQADNMSIKSLCSLLSREKQVNYIYTGKDKNLYDWDFHFKYDDLMKEELESSFGVGFKHINLLIDVTFISKK